MRKVNNSGPSDERTADRGRVELARCTVYPVIRNLTVHELSDI